MLYTPWLIVLVWYPHVINHLADSISVVPSWAGGILRLCAGERSLYGLLLNIKCSLGAEESSYPVVVLTPSPGRTSPPPPPTHTHRPLVNILSFSHKHTHTHTQTCSRFTRTHTHSQPRGVAGGVVRVCKVNPVKLGAIKAPPTTRRTLSLVFYFTR